MSKNPFPFSIRPLPPGSIRPQPPPPPYPPPPQPPRKFAAPPPLARPINFCKSPCPASCSPACLPNCCGKLPPSLYSQNIALPPPPPAPLSKELVCTSEGATEVCGEKGFSNPHDQSQNPPGTVVIPLPPTTYQPSKPGEPPTELPIPDITLPLAALQGNHPPQPPALPQAPAAENQLGCAASCPQSCAPECRDDCCVAEVPVRAPNPPIQPPPRPPPPPPPPLESGVPGVVELNPTLINLPNPLSSAPSLIELKATEVEIPTVADSCPAHCSPHCLPDCDYDCCRPYLDPNIVSEMSKELNYYHPN